MVLFESISRSPTPIRSSSVLPARPPGVIHRIRYHIRGPESASPSSIRNELTVRAGPDDEPLVESVVQISVAERGKIDMRPYSQKNCAGCIEEKKRHGAVQRMKRKALGERAQGAVRGRRERPE